MAKLGLPTILLAILLAGCGGSLPGDASAGPNPGGGFYGGTEHRHWTDQSVREAGSRMHPSPAVVHRGWECEIRGGICRRWHQPTLSVNRHEPPSTCCK